MDTSQLGKKKISHFLDIRFNELGDLSKEFIRYGKVKKYRKGDVIYSIGDTVNSLCYIEDGLVGATRILENGNELYIFLLGKHCLFPDCFYLTNVKVESEMRALRNTTVIEFEKENINTLLNNSVFIKYLLYSISLKGVLVANRIHQEFNADREARLLNLLYELAAFAGVEEDGVCTIYFTHEELAAMLAMHRTTVSKLLSQLNQRNMISCKRKKIQLRLN